MKNNWFDFYRMIFIISKRVKYFFFDRVYIYVIFYVVNIMLIMNMVVLLKI